MKTYALIIIKYSFHLEFCKRLQVCKLDNFKCQLLTHIAGYTCKVFKGPCLQTKRYRNECTYCLNALGYALG